ncbi:hypothetical protein TcasGA2_TC034882 [Tribolium castaneum]|uniref:Uncharacterized protein n=1 Tax=Tribolium castaneum TaxID=7070 RepID=A0A139WB99_TRICA|nr:hypothetical protein TcasGA2_TC034882 [Tribolium castaneum]
MQAKRAAASATYVRKSFVFQRCPSEEKGEAAALSAGPDKLFRSRASKANTLAAPSNARLSSVFAIISRVIGAGTVKARSSALSWTSSLGLDAEAHASAVNVIVLHDDLVPSFMGVINNL